MLCHLSQVSLLYTFVRLNVVVMIETADAKLPLYCYCLNLVDFNELNNNLVIEHLFYVPLMWNTSCSLVNQVITRLLSTCTIRSTYFFRVNNFLLQTYLHNLSYLVLRLYFREMESKIVFLSILLVQNLFAVKFFVKRKLLCIISTIYTLILMMDLLFNK